MRRRAEMHAKCRTRPAEISEQPSGEFTSTDQIAGDGDEADSSQQATRSVFSRPSGSFPHTSEWEDICTELALTER